MESDQTITSQSESSAAYYFTKNRAANISSDESSHIAKPQQFSSSSLLALSISNNHTLPEANVSQQRQLLLSETDKWESGNDKKRAAIISGSQQRNLLSDFSGRTSLSSTGPWQASTIAGETNVAPSGVSDPNPPPSMSSNELGDSLRILDVDETAAKRVLTRDSESSSQGRAWVPKEVAFTETEMSNAAVYPGAGMPAVNDTSIEKEMIPYLDPALVKDSNNIYLPQKSVKEGGDLAPLDSQLSTWTTLKTLGVKPSPIHTTSGGSRLFAQEAAAAVCNVENREMQHVQQQENIFKGHQIQPPPLSIPAIDAITAVEGQGSEWPVSLTASTAALGVRDDDNDDGDTTTPSGRAIKSNVNNNMDAIMKEPLIEWDQHGVESDSVPSPAASLQPMGNSPKGDIHHIYPPLGPSSPHHRH